MSLVTEQDIQESMKRLKTIPDKSTWKTTTSHVFKLNIAQYLSNKDKKKVIEFGAAQGHTTFFISPLVDDIVSIDFNYDNCRSIDDLKCTNVRSMCVDLYDKNFLSLFSGTKFDLVIIDAIHTYENVKIDIQNAKELGIKEYIFDDYGSFPEVKRAIDEFIETLKNEGKAFQVQRIGMPPGSYFSNTIFKILADWEGVIITLN